MQEAAFDAGNAQRLNTVAGVCRYTGAASWEQLLRGEGGAA